MDLSGCARLQPVGGKGEKAWATEKTPWRAGRRPQRRRDQARESDAGRNPPQVSVQTHRNPINGGALSLIDQPTQERRARRQRAKEEGGWWCPVEPCSDRWLRKHGDPNQGGFSCLEQGKHVAERADAEGKVKASGAVPEDHSPKQEPDAAPGQAFLMPGRRVIVRVRARICAPSQGKVEEWVEVSLPNGEV